MEKADYVQESIPDDYDLKKRIFRELDEAAPVHALLASSSSGLLMSEIQKSTQMPHRCVMVHPMLPVHIIPAVEIVGGNMTASETIETTCNFMESLGKTPIILNHETPGYIVNRLQAAMLREAIDLVDRGIVSPEMVDKACCQGIGLRGPFVGPFLKMHLTGNGIEGFFANFSQSYRYRWESMESWTSVSASAAKAVIKGTREMEIVCQKSLEETKRWRDEQLMKIMQVVLENQFQR